MATVGGGDVSSWRMSLMLQTINNEGLPNYFV